MIGEKLFLDSGTLTPLLRKLELKGLIIRERLKEDERSVVISLTAKGKSLQNKARHIPQLIESKLGLSREEIDSLYSILNKILNNVENNKV